MQHISMLFQRGDKQLQASKVLNFSSVFIHNWSDSSDWILLHNSTLESHIRISDHNPFCHITIPSVLLCLRNSTVFGQETKQVSNQITEQHRQSQLSDKEHNLRRRHFVSERKANRPQGVQLTETQAYRPV